VKCLRDGVLQGTDPGTDLRGVGMLGLLQLLYLSNTPHLIPLARDIYRVSVDDQQNFPLAVMSLNMTRIALQALRRGELNRYLFTLKVSLCVPWRYFWVYMFSSGCS
jgi:membrane protein CcdC involved in cytochrome C biogenesis